MSPPCSYPGCRRPVVASFPGHDTLSFCRMHLRVFHGAPAAVPGEEPPAAKDRIDTLKKDPASPTTGHTPDRGL